MPFASDMKYVGGKFEYGWIAVVVVILLVVAAIILGVRHFKKKKRGSKNAVGAGSAYGGAPEFPPELEGEYDDAASEGSNDLLDAMA